MIHNEDQEGLSIVCHVGRTGSCLINYRYGTKHSIITIIIILLLNYHYQFDQYPTDKIENESAGMDSSEKTHKAVKG